MPLVRGLTWVAAVESMTLLLLLVNLATVHVAAVASAVGPLHGTAYLAGIALTWTRPTTTRARLLAIIPAVGAWLARREVATG